MKLITHDIFAFGLSTYVLARVFSTGIATSVILSLVLAFATNRIIDAGHTQKHGYPTRSYITHSIFTAPIWGLLVGLAISTIVLFAFHVNILFLGAVSGILIAYAHLFLDAPTEGGVFFWRKRIALAHFRYNNALANGFAILVGILLLAITVL
ncbi:MAG: DUF1286 domain-containing protein [Candidatus Micrarchaeaceae archaeon]